MKSEWIRPVLERADAIEALVELDELETALAEARAEVARLRALVNEHCDRADAILKRWG